MSTEIDSFLATVALRPRRRTPAILFNGKLTLRRFKNNSSNVLIRVVLRFELSISDSPTASYDENHYLYFNDAYLELWDRQMHSDGFFMGDPLFDKDSEHLRKIGNYGLSPSTFADI